MKKKFIFLTMMLLTFLGVNVLNAQIDLTKQYRLKVSEGGYAGNYLHVNSFYAPNNQPQVGIAAKAENTNQIFTLEDAGNGNYYLKCATNDYYIKCAVGEQWWCVYAYSTTEKTPLYFHYTDGTNFYLRDYDKMMGIGGTGANLTTNNYFKVENYGVYCDAAPNYTPSENSYVTTWSLEEYVPVDHSNDCLVIFTLADSYGDGWNGGKIDLTFNGETQTINYSGNSNIDEYWNGQTARDVETHQIWIPQGSFVTVSFSGSQYASEMLCRMTYEDGTVINAWETKNSISNNMTYDFEVDCGKGPLAVTATADKYEIMDIESVKLTATAEGGVAPYSYSWSPATGLDNATSATPVFTPEGEGVYEFTCTVTDTEGTVETASVTITVNDGSDYCVLKLTLEDTYGDGWNGNYLTVQYGTTSEDVTLETVMGSSYKEVEMIVLSGSEVTVTFHGTAYTYENILTIECGNVYKKYIGDGSSYAELTDGVYYTFTASCEPAPEGLAASPDKLYPDGSTTITWNPFEGALSYNVYVNDELKGNTTETSYELSNIPYENTIAVEAVLEGGELSGKAYVSVQVAGTFNLVLNVKDNESQPIDGATVTITGSDEFGAEISEKFITVDGIVEKTLYLPEKETQYTIEVNKQFYGTEYTEVANFSWPGYVENASTVTREVTLQLNGISNVNTDKEYYDEGEPIILSWNAIKGATYNVYVNDEETARNAKPLTSATYTIEDGLRYKEIVNNTVYVTAVYTVGESDKFSGTPINVNGYGKVLVSVTDGTNPIVGANIVITGSNGEIELITSADGTVEKDVVVGDYTITASKYNYEGAEQNVSVAYQGNPQIDFVLTSYPILEFDVTATHDNDNDNVTVTWEAPEGATQYNVFRKDATEAVVKLTEAPMTEQEYLATDWNELSNGTYQYGVSAFVGGGSETFYSDDFSASSGWTGSTNWKIESGQLYISTTVPYSKSRDITSPAISIGNNVPTLQYDYNNNHSNKTEVHVKVDGVEWKIETIEGIVATTSKIELGDNVIAGGVLNKDIQIIFKSYGGYGQTYIDNVTVYSESSPVESSINWSGDVKKTSANVFTGAGGTNEWKLASNWSNGIPADGANVFIESNVTIASNVNVNNITINGGSVTINTDTDTDTKVVVNNMTINGGSVTINSGASLTVNGTLVNEDEANLVINDGAQIFQNNEEIPATFVMNINNWTDNEYAWQFIASPLLDASLFSHATGNYDLFKYYGNEDLEWYNHKLHAGNFGSTFEQGVGYLASHETETKIELTGTLNAENSYSWDNLTYNNGKDLANFHLVGNPFPFDMQWNKIEMWHVIDGYAIVNDGGGYTYSNSELGGEIKAGDGFFVKTNGTSPSMYYDHKASVSVASVSVARRGTESNNSLNITATGNAGKDNVVINFAGKSEGFDKLQNFNDAIATVYVAEDGKNYGIYNCNSDIEEVVVSFNAKDMGDYTIAAVAEGDFSSVVLVDLFTGIETDLLTSGYTFAAKSGDNAERFVVRFSYSQESAMDSNFVYQSGEDLIIMAEGALQIVDMLGRVVYYSEVATDVTRVNVSNFDNAAYIVRVVNGEGVKTQKVVIY